MGVSIGEMMKFKIITVLTLLSCLTSMCVFGDPASKPAAPAVVSASANGPFICPVTGDKIATVKDAVGKSVYKGKTYYFCCDECKPMFDANPAKYAKPSATAAKKTAAASK